MLRLRARVASRLKGAVGGVAKRGRACVGGAGLAAVEKEGELVGCKGWGAMIWNPET